MKSFIPILILSVSFLALPLSVNADEKKEEPKKITYDEHILPIFRQRCGSCHNGNDQKGGLVLDTYAGMMQGGGSGDVLEPGDASASYLFTVITHESEPVMPPNQPKMPDNEIALIKQWLDLGALENQGSKIVQKSNSLAKIEISTDRPADAPILPENVSLAPATLTDRPNSSTALAVSPWASLAALSGHEQVILYNTQTGLLAGVLPYPEGTPQIAKFSRNGQLLLVGGGRGGASGRVIVFNVKTGQRVAELGNEYDAVLAADISSDHALVVMCGPKRMVRVYSVQTGELLYEKKKHTDWVTAAEFSPDGVLLATADRSNGMVLWEAMTGNEYLNLKGHTGAITDVSWRPDSNLLASASEDGTIRLWELNDGNEVKRWNAHGGGVTAVDFTRNGNLVSIGRDRVAKLWQADGNQLKTYSGLPDYGMEVAFDAETNRVLGGDWTGEVRVWDAESQNHLFSLSSNPPAMGDQLAQANTALAAVQTQLKGAQDELAGIQQKIAAREQGVAAQKKKIQDSEALLTTWNNELNAEEQKRVAAEQKTKQADEAVKVTTAVQQNATKQVETSVAELNQQNETIKGLNDQKTKADVAVTEATKKLQDLQNAAEKNEEQIKAAELELAAAQKAVTDVVAQLTAANAKLTELQQKKASADNALKDADGKLNQAKTDLQQSQAALNASTQAKDAKAKQIADGQKALPELKKQLEELEKNAPVTEAEKKRMDELNKLIGDQLVLVKAQQDQVQKIQQQLASSQQAATN